MYKSSIEWWHYIMAGAVLLLVLVMFCQALPRLTTGGTMLAENPTTLLVH